MTNAKVLGVTNSNKTVAVTGHVLHDELTIQVHSSLYCSWFCTFQIVNELDDIIELNDDFAVRVIQSRKWFGWDNNVKPFLPSIKLILH